MLHYKGMSDLVPTRPIRTLSRAAAASAAIVVPATIADAGEAAARRDGLHGYNVVHNDNGRWVFVKHVEFQFGE